LSWTGVCNEWKSMICLKKSTTSLPTSLMVVSGVE
jgi:hypothetical protein